MWSSVGRDDDAAGENYLVIDHVVTGEAITGGEIWYSAWSSYQYQISTSIQHLPPVNSPPTPILEPRPPTTVRFFASISRYTSPHIAPAPTDAILLSALIVTSSIERMSIVTPPLMLALPAHGVWPPPRIANWHPRTPVLLSKVNVLMVVTTSSTVVGETTQLGAKDSSCLDQ